MKYEMIGDKIIISDFSNLKYELIGIGGKLKYDLMIKDENEQLQEFIKDKKIKISKTGKITGLDVKYNIPQLLKLGAEKIYHIEIDTIYKRDFLKILYNQKIENWAKERLKLYITVLKNLKGKISKEHIDYAIWLFGCNVKPKKTYKDKKLLKVTRKYLDLDEDLESYLISAVKELEKYITKDIEYYNKKISVCNRVCIIKTLYQIFKIFDFKNGILILFPLDLEEELISELDEIEKDNKIIKNELLYDVIENVLPDAEYIDKILEKDFIDEKIERKFTDKYDKVEMENFKDEMILHISQAIKFIEKWNINRVYKRLKFLSKRF